MTSEHDNRGVEVKLCQGEKRQFKRCIAKFIRIFPTVFINQNILKKIDL